MEYFCVISCIFSVRKTQNKKSKKRSNKFLIKPISKYSCKSMVEVQLFTCIESYLQLTSFLNENREHVEQFVDARVSIISGISVLNSMLPEWRHGVGRLCLTPRLVDGYLDIGIIISSEGEGMWKFVWMYPRNKYEICSTGILTSQNKLTEYSQSMQQERYLKLRSMVHGDSVLVRSDVGTFVPGILQKRLVRGLATVDASGDTVLEIKIDHGNTVTVDENLSIVIPNDFSEVKRHSCNVTGSMLRQKGGVHVYQIDEDKSCSSGSDDDDDDDETSELVNARALVALRTLQTEGHVLGSWERHTKGVCLQFMIIS